MGIYIFHFENIRIERMLCMQIGIVCVCAHFSCSFSEYIVENLDCPISSYLLLFSLLFSREQTIVRAKKEKKKRSNQFEELWLVESDILFSFEIYDVGSFRRRRIESYCWNLNRVNEFPLLFSIDCFLSNSLFSSV